MERSGAISRLVVLFCLFGFAANAAQADIYGRYPRYPRAPKHPKAAHTGEVKLENAPKSASVYVDGALAGTAAKLKKFDLKPGKHTIEVKDSDGRSYREKVQILKGKSVTLHVNFQATNS